MQRIFIEDVFIDVILFLVVKNFILFWRLLDVILLCSDIKGTALKSLII